MISFKTVHKQAISSITTITVCRWRAPISIAIYTPGNELNKALDEIRFIRECKPESSLIKQWVTFHFYFETILQDLPDIQQLWNSSYDCAVAVEIDKRQPEQHHNSEKHANHPGNVGLNVAREAALTHFILAVDFKYYPSMDLVPKFLKMIARNQAYLQRPARRLA